MDAGTELGARSIWPSIYPEILRLVEQHRSTIVFVNNRRLAERLALRLNELAERELARAHHGSLAREQRVEVEELLKKGEIPCLVATSSLELGIDMGAVDLVIQVESPKSVARGLQRVGGRAMSWAPSRRAGSSRSSARISSNQRSSPAACGTARSRRPSSRATRSTCSHSTIVAICAEEEVAVDDLHDLVRGAYPFCRPLSRPAGERARHARRPLSVRRVRGAAASHHLGSHGRDDPRPGRRPPAGGDERRHDPGPRALHGAARRLGQQGR